MSTFRVQGPLSVTGDVAVATNKFTVASASGNTVIAGTFQQNTAGSATAFQVQKAGVDVAVIDTSAAAAATTLTSYLTVNTAAAGSANAFQVQKNGVDVFAVDTSAGTAEATMTGNLTVTGTLDAGAVDFTTLSAQNIVLGSGTAVAGNANTAFIAEFHPAAVAVAAGDVDVDLCDFAKTAGTAASGQAILTVGATVYGAGNVATGSATAQFTIGLSAVAALETFVSSVSAGFGFVSTDLAIIDDLSLAIAADGVTTVTVHVASAAGATNVKVWGIISMVNNFDSGITVV